MLVLRDGKTLGTIGGGCVEAEVRTRAMKSLANGQEAVFHFRLDHDHGWDDGLVCGGVMEVAVEVIDKPDRARSIARTRDRLASGRDAVVNVTVPDERGQAETFSRTIQPARHSSSPALATSAKPLPR